MQQQHNPYAAPEASAVESLFSPERLVRIAVGLYVASFLLMLPSAVVAVLEPDPELDDTARLAIAIGIAVVCSLMALFTAFISRGLLRGSRGARSWLIGATALWIAGLLWPDPDPMEFDWQAALDMASLLVRIAAGVMMFWPGVPRWFGRDLGRVEPRLE